MDDVERIFRHLVEVLADKHPERINQPLQASEIYQTFLPYRRFRSALMFDTNQDYEMAILRLLAGENGYASIEPPQAQADLKAEADAVNPNPSAIREYAGVKVFLNANMVRDMIDGREAYAPPDDYEEDSETETLIEEAEIESFVGARYEIEEDDEPEPESEVAQVQTDDDENLSGEEDGADELVLSEPDDSTSEPEDDSWDGGADEAAEGAYDGTEWEPAEPEETDSVEIDEQEEVDIPISEPTDKSYEEGSPEPPTEGARTTCVHCGEGLPSTRQVVFCPFCGTNQSVRECSQCGAELEDGWVFCVECGAGVDTDR